MADYLVTDTELTNVANAIRTKAGLSVTLEFPSEFVSAIANIPTGGTLQSKTVSPTTSAQTITPDSGYDGLSQVTVNAMPSGSAGTPTATKGTVSNHSVSVTPSVTNTTGYITGGTKNGTAVTVSASELVSGTKSITENGTGIDVANYAAVDVNVSGGGGGIVYEEGTYEPTADTNNLTISFSEEHTTGPFLAYIYDDTGDIAPTDSILAYYIVSTYNLSGTTIFITSSTSLYAQGQYIYKTSSSQGRANIQAGSTSALDQLLDAEGLYFSTSRYFRANRTYKWIAVWKPTV